VAFRLWVKVHLRCLLQLFKRFVLLLSPRELFRWLIGGIFLEECRFQTLDLGLTLSIFHFEFLYGLITLLLLPLEDVKVVEVLGL